MEKELLEKLAKSVADLTETITAKFSTADPKGKESETNALVETVLKKLADSGLRPPTQRKMAWAVTGKQLGEGVEAVPFSKFLKACRDKDFNFLAEVKAATGQSEDIAADGGNVVPVEYANEIVKLERQASVARSIARIFPMGSLTRKIPRELAKPTAAWVGEGVEVTPNKGTLAQINQTAKKLISIVPFTDELLEDNNVSYDNFIAEVVSSVMGREEDKQAFVGDVSGVSDPFNGVFFESGVSVVSLVGADVAYEDLINILMAPGSPYRGRAQFVLSASALKKIMKLVDDNNKPIWSMPALANPGTILGKKYLETDQIPDTLGSTRTNGAKTAILFGAWDGLWISPRGGYTVKASDSASSSSANAFSLDETWFKFRRRQAITVANPEAFARMSFTAA